LNADASHGVARTALKLFTVAVFGLIALLAVSSILVSALLRDTAGNRDFIEYWAAGQLLVHGQNPYDTAAIEKLERAAGLSRDKPALVMGNAPPALLIVAPLGFVSARNGQRVWTVILLVALLLSVRLMRTVFRQGPPYVWILACTFAPALACIAVEQMAMLVLLGVALFLRFHRTFPLIAGASLWLCLLKPQLFLPFGLILAVWIWKTHQYKIFAGVVGVFVGSTLLIAWVDPGCWSQYGAMMKVQRYDQANIPCLAMVLRDVLGGRAAVQYAPAAVACVWALVYFWHRKDEWDWLKHGSPLLLTSLMVAPYSWFVDQCVAIPALMRGLQVTCSRMLVVALAGASMVIEIAQLYGRPMLHSNYYLWNASPFMLTLLVMIITCSPKQTLTGAPGALGTNS